MRGTKERPVSSLIIGILTLGALASLESWAAKVTSIDFKGTGDPSEVDISTDGPITVDKQENAQDKQIVLELSGASITKSNARKIDTSSFNSNVSQISSYQVDGQPDKVRVVVQLRNAGSGEVAQEGTLVKLLIPNSGVAQASPPSTVSVPDSISPPVGITPPAAEASDNKTNLDSFMDAKDQQKFTGKPVSIQVKDADVSDVLRLIGEASGFNIIVGDDVHGKVSLSLTDVPWDQALDVVLHTLHLGADRNANILRVVTLKNFLEEKQEQLRAEKLANASAPRITQIFPISYAKLTELQPILRKFASQDLDKDGQPGLVGGGAGGGTQQGAGSASVVEIDNRTNSFIVRDVPANIAKMKKLIELLDTQTPQVMIEAKIIEATEGFSNSLNGNLGIGGLGSSSWLASATGGNPLDSLVGSPGVFTGGSAVATASSTGAGNGTFGFSPNMSFLPGVSRLNAVLSWGESDSQLKIVSAPKTVVLNKETASIVEGTPVLVPGTTTVAGVGTVPTTSVQQANISLTVKPTVTNDGSVLMELNISKDVPTDLGGGQSGIGNRNMKTLVMVESGATLVIGGVYTMQTTHSSSGVPILRKLPIIGALFGSESDSTQRSELFIFITPRVLNMKEAGLSG